MGALIRWSISKFGYDFGRGLVHIFLVVFLQQLAGGSLTDAGLILAMLMGIQAVLVCPFGWLSDKIGRRGLLLIGGVMDSIVLYMLSTVTKFADVYLVIILLAVGGAIRAGALAPFEMDLSGKKRLGTKLSSVMLVSDLAMILAAAAGGYVLDAFGFSQMFVIAAILMFVFNLGIFFVKPGGGGK